MNQGRGEPAARPYSTNIAGKLVPQDPNDEPAEKLLKRINASKS